MDSFNVYSNKCIEVDDLRGKIFAKSKRMASEKKKKYRVSSKFISI